VSRRPNIQPSFSMNTRVDLETHQRRERLQTNLNRTLPELLKMAFAALDEKLSERGKAAA
jgi:hypothetical protein